MNFGMSSDLQYLLEESKLEIEKEMNDVVKRLQDPNQMISEM